MAAGFDVLLGEDRFADSYLSRGSEFSVSCDAARGLL